MTFVDFMASKNFMKYLFFVLSSLKFSKTPHSHERVSHWGRQESKCTGAFPRSDKWLSTRLHSVTSTHHSHRTTLATPLPSFLPGERSRSITETDRCLWLGCCIRLFDEVTMISRCWEEAETPWTPRPWSKQAANRETGLRVKVGFYWLTVVMSKPESNDYNEWKSML